MSKLLLSTFILLSFFAFSTQAQNRRLENLASDLQRSADDLADKAYSEFSNRSSNSRSETENLLLAQQIRASAEIFKRLVSDNRRDSELRDAANVLNDLSKRATFNYALSDYFRKVQRNIDDVTRSIGGGSGRDEPKLEKEVIGRVRWRGTIDDEVQLFIRESKVEVKTISGTTYNDAIFDFTSGLPNRKVDVFVNKKKGRGSVKVIQSPSRENDFTTVIQIRDKDGGAREYDLDIYWTR